MPSIGMGFLNILLILERLASVVSVGHVFITISRKFQQWDTLEIPCNICWEVKVIPSEVFLSSNAGLHIGEYQSHNRRQRERERERERNKVSIIY